ncbi:MAG: hypothetical protein MPJ78_06200 [Hyphomicrobiaceae bacterium]|nr:hypothetical protein [Hyphomicrobiaceae bacterium]
MIERRSALAGLLPMGAPARTDGVRIEELEDALQLQLFARNGKSGELARVVARFLKRKKPLAPLESAEQGGIFICAVGPREYWVLARGRSSAKNLGALEKVVKDHASVFEQTDGRFVIRLSGPRAADVLARGTSLDLHDPERPDAWGSHTLIEHIPALVLRHMHKSAAVYNVSVPRSYAGSFVAWLR